MKRLIFTGFFCVLGFGVTVFAQKLTPELLNKAREMGVSETRINEAINTQQGNTGRRTINNVVDTATSRNFDIISPNAEPTPTRTSDVKYSVREICRSSLTSTCLHRTIINWRQAMN